MKKFRYHRRLLAFALELRHILNFKLTFQLHDISRQKNVEKKEEMNRSATSLNRSYKKLLYPSMNMWPRKTRDLTRRNTPFRGDRKKKLSGIYAAKVDDFFQEPK